MVNWLNKNKELIEKLREKEGLNVKLEDMLKTVGRDAGEPFGKKLTIKSEVETVRVYLGLRGGFKSAMRSNVYQFMANMDPEKTGSPTLAIIWLNGIIIPRNDTND